MSLKESFDVTLAIECAKAFSCSCAVGCTVSDAEGIIKYESGYGCASCQICRSAGKCQEDCIRAHIYGMIEAERFGGKYIYFCPMGLTCFVSPILGGQRSEGKITVGPFLMVEVQDYIACDLEDRQQLRGERLQSVIAELGNVTYISAEKVNKMATLLFMAVGFMNNISAANKMLENKNSGMIQGQITAYIQQLKASDKPAPYPFETEQAMLRAVQQANKAEAQKFLNELLGHILFSSGGDFLRCKTRIYELLVLISRTAIKAGANPEETLNAGHGYLIDITQIQDFDALCLWLTKAMGILMDSIFDFSGSRHTSAIHQSIQYIHSHYDERITLEDMARRVYFSPAYFSRVFKDETGEAFSVYLNRVRIEKSKEQLLYTHLKLSDIALSIGYEDQSYFCKVFKKIEGVTPMQYRKSNLSDLDI
mgnify:CR=1 FL=1